MCSLYFRKPSPQHGLKGMVTRTLISICPHFEHITSKWLEPRISIHFVNIFRNLPFKMGQEVLPRRELSVCFLRRGGAGHAALPPSGDPGHPGSSDVWSWYPLCTRIFIWGGDLFFGCHTIFCSFWGGGGTLKKDRHLLVVSFFFFLMGAAGGSLSVTFLDLDDETHHRSLWVSWCFFGLRSLWEL